MDWLEVAGTLHMDWCIRIKTKCFYAYIFMHFPDIVNIFT